MKTHQFISLVAGLALGAGFSAHAAVSAIKLPDNVTVTFQDPDHFTDVQERSSSLPSEAYLTELRECVQHAAARAIPAGSKLSVTFLDIDLAGLIRPDKDNLRVMTATTLPRAHLKFQLVDAAGQTLQEGERRLVDMDYQQSTKLFGRNEELFYDKELLQEWVAKEFKAGA